MVESPSLLSIYHILSPLSPSFSMKTFLPSTPVPISAPTSMYYLEQPFFFLLITEYAIDHFGQVWLTCKLDFECLRDRKSGFYSFSMERNTVITLTINIQ